MFRYPLTPEAWLCPLEIRHAEALFDLAVANKARLMPWFGWMHDGICLAETRAFVDDAVRRPGRNDGFEACLFVEGRLAGMVGFHTIDWRNRKTSIGYWVDAAIEGRGLVTRAVSALLDHAFTDLSLHRVEICAQPHNHRSLAVPRRLGFTCEGLRRGAEKLRDTYIDHTVHAILAPEWAIRSAHHNTTTAQ